MASRKGGGKQRVCAALLPAVLALLAWGAPAHAQSLEPGTIAPSFAASTLPGKQVSLEDLRGRPLLINKWATWCRPCVAEMPALQQLHQQFQDRDFSVVGISIDRPGAEQQIEAVLDERGVTYPIWLDPDDTFTSTFRSTGVPDSILLDREGRVVHRWIGGLRATSETKELIELAVASDGDYPAGVVAGQEGAAASAPLVLGLLIALGAGLLSFVSPCVLPLVPSYVAFVTGLSISGAATDKTGPGPATHTALANGALFVAGFSTIFLLLGASATAIGAFARDNAADLAKIGGVLLIVFGVILIGILRLPGLNREFRLLERVTRGRKLGYGGSYLVGAAFGAGWTPCIGPVLAGILTLAATSEGLAEGIGLLAAYSLGLGIPFLLATVALDRFLLTSTRLRRVMPWVQRVSGALLVIVGVLLFSGALTQLSEWFAGWAPDGLG